MVKTSPYVKYSFAKQYLDAKRIDIFADGEQILKYQSRPNHPLSKIQTSIEIGDSLTEEDMVIELSYRELMRLGFCLVSYTPPRIWAPRQSVAYKITRYYEGTPHLGQVPKTTAMGNHFVLYAPKKKALQLVGPKSSPSGYGPVVYLDKFGRQKNKSNTGRDLSKYFDTSKDEETSFFDRQMKKNIPGLDLGPKFVEIPEIPVLFSVETNEVVCIPVEVADIPKMGFVGKTGSGKTYGGHSVFDMIKWKTNHEMAILNDNSNQTFMWALPNQDNSQAAYLDKVGAEPRALPIVPLYPTTDDLNENDMLLREEISQLISMEFSDVVENFDYFFEGREKWKLGASDKWFRQCKDEIKEAKSIKEIEDILVNNIGHIKGLKPTIGKITSIFRDMMDMNFTNLSSKMPATWKFEDNLAGVDYEKNPVLGLMRCGAVPSLITTNLGRKEYYPHYMRYYMDSIYDNQIHRNKPVWMFVDEVGNINKRNNKRTVASDSFIKCCTEGRIRQLGVLYTIQNYSKLDEEIRNNTNYLFSCIYTDSKEINTIAKDFALENKRKKELSNLKQHEAILMSNDKPLVIYNFDGERREEIGVSYKGFTIPCLSEHRRPGKQL